MRARERARVRRTLAAATLVACRAVCVTAGSAALGASTEIFRDALAAGWSDAGTDWSWSGTVAVVPGLGRAGSNAFCANLTAWGGATLVKTSPPFLSPSSVLLFWLAPTPRTSRLNYSSIQLVRATQRLFSAHPDGRAMHQLPMFPMLNSSFTRLCAAGRCSLTRTMAHRSARKPPRACRASVVLPVPQRAMSSMALHHACETTPDLLSSPCAC